MTVEVLKEVCEHYKDQGFVIDGLPKNAKQAQLLKDANIDKAIVADLSEADLVEYFGNRVQDPQDPGKFYDLKKDPPPEGEVAERCTKRDDDAEDKVKERLQPYFAEVAGILAAFGDKVVKVAGTTKTGKDAEAANTEMFDAVKTGVGLV
jgi:adenylate kinase family enzyme